MKNTNIPRTIELGEIPGTIIATINPTGKTILQILKENNMWKPDDTGICLTDGSPNNCTGKKIENPPDLNIPVPSFCGQIWVSRGGTRSGYSPTHYITDRRIRYTPEGILLSIMKFSAIPIEEYKKLHS